MRLNHWMMQKNYKNDNRQHLFNREIYRVSKIDADEIIVLTDEI